MDKKYFDLDIQLYFCKSQRLCCWLFCFYIPRSSANSSFGTYERKGLPTTMVAVIVKTFVGGVTCEKDRT